MKNVRDKMVSVYFNKGLLIIFIFIFIVIIVINVWLVINFIIKIV